MKASIEKNGYRIVLVALAVVFIWFGALKIVGFSQMTPLVQSVLFFLPTTLALILLGSLEILLGLSILWKRTADIGLHAMWILLIGTFITFFIAPDLVFQNNNPLLLTMEGQFVLKNFVLLGAAIVMVHKHHKNAV
jgi:uncharacterized membrane protein YkgB